MFIRVAADINTPHTPYPLDDDEWALVQKEEAEQQHMHSLVSVAEDIIKKSKTPN